MNSNIVMISCAFLCFIGLTMIALGLGMFGFLVSIVSLIGFVVYSVKAVKQHYGANRKGEKNLSAPMNLDIASEQSLESSEVNERANNNGEKVSSLGMAAHLTNLRSWINQNPKTAKIASVAAVLIGFALFEPLGGIAVLLVFFGVFSFLVVRRITKSASVQGHGLKEPPIFLTEGEKVLVSKYALRCITKNRVVGRTAGFGGVSIPLGRGFRTKVGGYKSHSIYGDVSNYYRGEFVLTNKRMVFVAAQHGFEFPLTKISAIAAGNNNSCIITTKQLTCEMVIVSSLKPKQVNKFLQGKLDKFNVSANPHATLSDLVARVRASSESC